MKVIINAKDFKNITERTAVVCAKKSAFISLEGLFLTANKDTQEITVKASNAETYAEVHMRAEVAEGGNAFIKCSDLKRLYNVTGEITLTAKEQFIRAKNSKKQSEVCTCEVEEIAFPSIVFDRAFSADKEEMLDTFTKLSCYLSDNNRNPVLTGFNVASTKNSSRIISCDCCRIGRRKVEWDMPDGLNITIPGRIVKELAKVSANKCTENIDVFTNNKYVWFVGKDFTYTAHLLTGTYPDAEKNIDEAMPHGFTTNATSLCSIAKEYMGIVKGTNMPMFVWYLNTGKLIAAVVNNDNYRTADVVEATVENIPKDFRHAFNPAYIKDATAIFGKKDVRVKFDVSRRFSPWTFSGEDGYEVLVLPVNPGHATIIEPLEEFVKSL